MSADNHAKPDDDKGEPHENDKCMDDGHRRPNEGMSKLRAQVTSAVANIPSLVIVLLCVLLLVFFVIIIALAVQVHSSGSAESPRCLTAACLATAAGVLGSLDTRADPCARPYAFACDGARSPLAGHRSRLDAQARLRQGVHRQLRHLVDLVPPHAAETSAASKVKRFYETCMEPRGLTADALAVFVHMVRQAGGWDLIRASAWSMQSWNRDTTLEKLIVGLGVTPFFRITVASPDVSVIRMEPAGFAFPSYEYYADGAPKHHKELLQAYRELIEKVTDLLRDGSASRSNSAIADVVINYERRLLERLRPLGNVTEAYRKTTVGELGSLVPIASTSLPLVKWDQLLTAFFQGQSITKSTPVILSQPHYFQGLSQIISTTDTTTLNHYIMWRMAMKYAPHLDKGVRSLYYRFMQTINGAPEVDVPEEEWWEQCARHTSHYLGHAVGKLYADTLEDKEPLLEQAREIAEQVRQSASNHIASVNWIHGKERLLDKINNVQFQLGYSSELTDKKLDDYYLNLIVKLGSHLDNVFEAEKFLTMKQAALLKGRRDSQLDEMWPVSPQDTTAIYQYEKNTVVVPLAALQKPLFSLDQHKALQYGSFGSLVGSLMFKMMDRTAMDMGSGPVFADNATRSSYQAKLRCLAESYPSLSEDKELKINGQLTAGEALADVAGLTAAYKAFKGRAEGMERLPGLDWSPEQLFFIGYAQSMCESVREERVVNWNATSTSAPNRLRVLQTLHQVPEFAAAFQCSTDSEMRNSREPCYAW
ncbi:unnamed protein product [Ixodes hexagonus]